MNILKYYNKAFIGGYWMVVIRDNYNAQSTYKCIGSYDGQWYADPFLIEANDCHYLFVEQYFNEKNRAGLGVGEIVDGVLRDFITILEKPYHMSYPCVFKYKGIYYMIPESSANQTLDLYEAEVFPQKWVHKKTLVDGRRLVDTTVFIKEDQIYLFSYESISNGWILHIYLLDLDNYTLSEVGDTFYNRNVGRPAGLLFEKEGRIFRPAQNCVSKYGESLLIYEIKELSRSSYVEEFAYEIKCADMNFETHYERIHTLNHDSRYEVVDVFQERFDLFHWWKIFKRKFLKK